ncbi:MAG: branched-chain-amino-acid transaminase [Armatimonadota bacterium]|nr:branched-chain-amino-acid transaminase [Armatimonadota bacterium]MDR7496799.1 branched-chain-amino-acid transaminase [Armatimonadota bacterium]MDR7512697.1 branched-chain-amino-acid transaminase [Armatimonadota bacterium]
MSGAVYVNGRITTREEAAVPVYDHGYLYGDGIFEGIRVYGGRIFKLEEHLDRLYESARHILLEIPLARDEMRRAILETVRASGLRDAYIRPVVSRGPGDLGLDPRKCARPTVVIIVDAIQLYPAEAYARGLRLITAAVRRPAPDALDGRIKSLNYLNNILARIEANRAGADEALLLTRDGYVCECSADNLFVVTRGEVWTPPPHLGLLRGVTRDTVLALAREAGLPAAERVFTLHDVYTADECFLTGTGAEVGPVVEVDGRRIGDGRPGPVTARLVAAFRALAQTTGTPVYVEDPAAGRR